MSTPQPPAPLTDQTRTEAREIIARYPQKRSALLPMLHLVQSVQGYVTDEGVTLCAEELGLTKAEVGAVVTFYSMYRRRPAGTYHLGVCTNTLCAVLGGDEIYRNVKEHLGIDHGETTEDGAVSLEHVECVAACDFAPVLMVNWEYYDNQTPQSARELVDALRAGDPPPPTRGPARLGTFTDTARVLAGFSDGRGGEGVQGGPPTLTGLELAKQRGDEAPAYPQKQEG
ncbi:MAG TPA: NADH-quinone oxidoreductase subunit NuoE [Mycobacteriales bacterium]|nr:NADH-quinone oxidoreductase subunit NuoE [Mycobacteriales bacterium]